MEDIEYSTCVPFIVVATDDVPRPAERTRQRREPTPWILQEEGEA